MARTHPMRMPGINRTVSFLMGGAVGVLCASFWAVGGGSEALTHVSQKAWHETKPVEKEDRGAVDKTGVVVTAAMPSPSGDRLNLDLPASALRDFSRYLRFPPLSQDNAFVPSDELIQLFGLSQGEVTGITQSIESAFEEMALAELSNTEVCRDEVKGEYFKIRPVESSGRLKQRFFDMIVEDLGSAKGLAVASILANSGLFSDFGSYPRIMYVDEKRADDGSSYFMLTQKRISDDLDEDRRDFGSHSMFMSKADINKRLGRLQEMLERN